MILSNSQFMERSLFLRQLPPNPPRTVITEILSICIQVRDCTCDRGVRILAIRQDHDIFILQVISPDDVLKRDNQQRTLCICLVEDYLLVFRSRRIYSHYVLLPDIGGPLTSERNPDFRCFHLATQMSASRVPRYLHQ
jgi:hypothetical protein